MKPLRDALIDYDLALCQAIAHKRGLPIPQNRSSDTLTQFAASLLSPASMAIALDDLSPEETAGLNYLLTHEGAVKSPQFSRTYGAIRSMGDRKLQRERPWENPANPAEGLWYRGLIFRGFRHTVDGPEEMIFIPIDLLAALPEKKAASPTTFQVDISPAPKISWASPASIREDFFTLLIYLQINHVRLTSAETIPQAHIQAIQEAFSYPQVQPQPVDDRQRQNWFDFILHLARRATFLVKQGQRLKLKPDTVKSWLQMERQTQIQFLQDQWRSDPTWNDLWHVPSLYPKDTGWENSPMLGRAKILDYLAQLPPHEWIAFTTFTKAIKQSDPDFQRPHGDYQTWYIYDQAGLPLMGFEHWDDVEGALIRYIIKTILFNSGVLELSAPAQSMDPTHFRLIDPLFFAPDKSAHNREKDQKEPARPRRLRINAGDLSVRVPDEASLYDRFQLARFAELRRRETNLTVYQITQESYRQALEQSISLEQILAFLNRATQGQVPLGLPDQLRRWDRQIGTVKLEQLTILRVSQADLIPELLDHPKLGPLLDRPFGKHGILVLEKNVPQVKKLLVELGYMD